MRSPTGLALLTLLIGCASENPTGRAPGWNDDLEACPPSVDAMFASRVVAPVQSGTGLCNVKGGMALCQRAGGIPGDSPVSMRPLGLHERNSRILGPQCLAATAGHVIEPGD